MIKERLIKARERKGYSQQNMADSLNMDKSSYNRRERGKTLITMNEWERIADILDCSIEDVYEADIPSMIFTKNRVEYLNTLGYSYHPNFENHIYQIPKNLLETQQKYIEVLEKKISEIEKS